MSERPKLVLITGGCKRIGAAIAARFASDGLTLALHGHTDAEPEEALAKYLEAANVEWHGFVADLASDADRTKLLQEVADHFGRVPDILVNNASLFEYDDWQNMDEANLLSHLKVNLIAPTLLTRALVEQSGEGAQPTIINIVDQRVRQPNGDQLSYTLSKQALAESIRSLASAFGARARINGVAPGLTLPTEDYDAAQMEQLESAMPLGELSEPADIADAVSYLAHAKVVTGQLLFVDGGAHMQHYERDFVFMGKD